MEFSVLKHRDDSKASGALLLGGPPTRPWVQLAVTPLLGASILPLILVSRGHDGWGHHKNVLHLALQLLKLALAPRVHFHFSFVNYHATGRIIHNDIQIHKYQ